MNEGLMLMPPHPDACQECARYPAHPPDQPHDAQSLYYQVAFKMKHGRASTWKDAVAHCSPEVRAAWEERLRGLGAWTEPKSEIPDVCPMPEAVLKNPKKARPRKR